MENFVGFSYKVLQNHRLKSRYCASLEPPPARHPRRTCKQLYTLTNSFGSQRKKIGYRIRPYPTRNVRIPTHTIQPSPIALRKSSSVSTSFIPALRARLRTAGISELTRDLLCRLRRASFRYHSRASAGSPCKYKKEAKPPTNISYSGWTDSARSKLSLASLSLSNLSRQSAIS